MRVVLKEFDETSVITSFVWRCIKKITVLLIVIIIVVKFFPDQVAVGLRYAYRFVPDVIISSFEKLHDALVEGNTKNSTSPTNNQLSEDLNRALQMVLIQVSEWDVNVASLQRYNRRKITEPWIKFGEVMRVVIDREGLGWSDQQAYASLIKEGDPIWKVDKNRSPAGIFRFGTAFGTYPRLRDLNIDYRQITGREYCVTEPNSINFNKLVDRNDVPASEIQYAVKMANRDGLYNLGIVIEYPRNVSNQEDLSCLFLYSGLGRALETYGSVEVNQADLEDIVYWLDRESNPVLVLLVSRDVKPILNLEPLPTPPPAYSQTTNSGR
jgi:L,D-peptidoglycan transpeptidase YkuD (ErfK/YbiS/YcfS/YnhG family)